MSAIILHRRNAAVAGAVRGSGPPAAAVDARRLPQSAVSGGGADHESAHPAAAPCAAPHRQARHRFRGRGAGDRHGRRWLHLRSAWRGLRATAVVGAAGAERDRAHALWTYLSAIFLYALLSLIAPGGYSPLQSVLATLCEPVLRPIRRLIPAVAGSICRRCGPSSPSRRFLILMR